MGKTIYPSQPIYSFNDWCKYIKEQLLSEPKKYKQHSFDKKN